MILAYLIIGDQLERIEIKDGLDIPANVVWVDLIEPTSTEEKEVEAYFKIDAPTREEMDKIEVMSPFYREGDAYYMTITALHNHTNDSCDSTAITFILMPNRCLVTLRYARPRSFSHFVARAIRMPEICGSPELVMEGLLEGLINNIADILEKTGNALDLLLKDLFDKQAAKKKYSTSENYNEIIRSIGRTGNLLSKNRESLVSINRMLIFYSQLENMHSVGKKEHKLRFKTIAREVHSLNEYVNFLSSRNGFLLDATLGMISVEQNMIIKVFTVAAAALMPPTLIASIYGMNFHNMPELSFKFGYPLALGLMVVSAVIPYIFLKKKGWL